MHITQLTLLYHDVHKENEERNYIFPSRFRDLRGEKLAKVFN